MSSCNFIRNVTQELHWTQKAGCPEHYYEQIYKSKIDEEFLESHRVIIKEDRKYPFVIDDICVISNGNNLHTDYDTDIQDTSTSQRVVLNFAVSGFLRYSFTETELRMLKLKDYAFYNRLTSFG